MLCMQKVSLCFFYIHVPIIDQMNKKYIHCTCFIIQYIYDEYVYTFVQFRLNEISYNDNTHTVTYSKNVFHYYNAFNGLFL